MNEVSEEHDTKVDELTNEVEELKQKVKQMFKGDNNNVQTSRQGKNTKKRSVSWYCYRSHIR